LFGTEHFSYWLEQMQERGAHFQWVRSQRGLWDRMKDLLHVLKSYLRCLLVFIFLVHVCGHCAYLHSQRNCVNAHLGIEKLEGEHIHLSPFIGVWKRWSNYIFNMKRYRAS
jgi:hypothetical protein